MPRVYYFGCVGEAGHYMHTPEPGLSHSWDFMYSNPWGLSLDDGFKGLQYKDGWTALAMHDYTVDSRSGSNSVFIAEGNLSEAEMVKLAYEFFPTIAKRIGVKSEQV